MLSIEIYNSHKILRSKHKDSKFDCPAWKKNYTRQSQG